MYPAKCGVRRFGQGEESISSLEGAEEYLQLHYSEVRSEVLAAGKGVGERLLGKAEKLGWPAAGHGRL
jgi:hypothetical protein